jgi:hypothetical protein
MYQVEFLAGKSEAAADSEHGQGILVNFATELPRCVSFFPINDPKKKMRVPLRTQPAW